MKLDIVCPLYGAEAYIDGFLARLALQTGIEISSMVFPITRSSDEASDRRVAERIEAAGGVFFFLDKSEFSHSLTRERAIFDYCTEDVVVMMSEDVILEEPEALLRLASAVNSECVFAYGRQLCPRKTIEHYVRNKNYGGESRVVSSADVEELQLKAFFASDAFSAYHRPTFLALGGYGGVSMMMSEDMYYAKKILDAGYQKAYVAEAEVIHFHTLTLRQLYRRYYATGIWFSEHPEFDGYKTTDSGLKLALTVLKAALKDFNLRVLLRWLPDMAARYLGMRKGKRDGKRKGKQTQC